MFPSACSFIVCCFPLSFTTCFGLHGHLQVCRIFYFDMLEGFYFAAFTVFCSLGYTLYISICVFSLTLEKKEKHQWLQAFQSYVCLVPSITESCTDWRHRNLRTLCHVTPQLKWTVHVPKCKWIYVCMYDLAQRKLSGCCFDTDLRKRYLGSDW
jgi:hypothetical protein